MWIELHDTLREHPKVIKLTRRLGIGRAQALGHITGLWMWALHNQPDGCLEQYDDEDIEIAALWDGEPGALHKAMVEVRLIDSNNQIHDWMEYAGSLKAAVRKRAQRSKRSRDVPGQSQDSHGTSQDSHDPVTGQSRTTRPDHDQTIDQVGVDQEKYVTSCELSAASNEKVDNLQSSPTGCSPLFEEEVYIKLKTKEGKDFPVTSHDLSKWRDAYPERDVEQELKRMKIWLEANPPKRKSYRGMSRFIVLWLSRKPSQQADRSIADLVFGGVACN